MNPECVSCDEKITDQKFHIVDGDYYCEECFNDNFFECEHCGKIASNDEQYCLENDLLCHYCYSRNARRCMCCNEEYYRSNMTRDTDGNYLCDDCITEYTTCYECGRFIHYEDVYDNNSYSYCQFCYENYFRIIQSYDYKPDDLIFYKLPYETCKKYFGIELEIDGAGEDHDNAADLINCFPCNHIYAKHDGSLDDGFELVSMPMTYKYIYSQKANWENMLSTANNMGYKSHDQGTCGLHIHISRQAFGNDTNSQELSIMKIIYLHEKFWPEILKFSRRTESQANRWAKKYINQTDVDDSLEYLNDPKKLLEYAKNQNNNSRYYAVNLENYSTIEFRIFRGTLKFNSFMATIQFVKLLTDICKRYSTQKIRSLTWNCIKKEISKSSYIELKKYIIERSL